jgi:hypothetical protein
MDCKMIEVRDRGTFIPMLAVRLGSGDDQERWLLSQAGFGRTSQDQKQYVLLANISGGTGHYRATCDKVDWTTRDRTRFSVHAYIEKHWEEILPGAVVDVEFILGESLTSKTTQRQDADF